MKSPEEQERADRNQWIAIIVCIVFIVLIMFDHSNFAATQESNVEAIRSLTDRVITLERAAGVNNEGFENITGASLDYETEEEESVRKQIHNGNHAAAMSQPNFVRTQQFTVMPRATHFPGHYRRTHSG